MTIQVTYYPADWTFSKTIADPSRRAILDALTRDDGQSLGGLCEHVDGMTRFGVIKHLRVLEEAHLIVVQRSGREKRHYLNPVPIQLLYDRWVGKYRGHIASALTELARDLEKGT